VRTCSTQTRALAVSRGVMTIRQVRASPPASSSQENAGSLAETDSTFNGVFDVTAMSTRFGSGSSPTFQRRVCAE
jgi:hypothetical protein